MEGRVRGQSLSSILALSGEAEENHKNPQDSRFLGQVLNPGVSSTE